MPVNLENSAVTTRLEKVQFHSNPKKGNAKECSNYHTIAFISSANKITKKKKKAFYKMKTYLKVILQKGTKNPHM